MVLGFGENQPRYSVLLAPGLSLLSAMALAPRQRLACDGTKSVNIAFGMLMVTFLFGFGVICMRVMKSRDRNPMLEARASHCSIYDIHNRLDNGEILESSYKRLRVVMSEGSGCETVDLPLSSGTRWISFFVSGGSFPFLWEPRILSPYRYKVEIGGVLFIDTYLAEAPVRWHVIDIVDYNFSDTSKVRFIVERTECETEDSFEISLYREISR